MHVMEKSLVQCLNEWHCPPLHGPTPVLDDRCLRMQAKGTGNQVLWPNWSPLIQNITFAESLLRHLNEWHCPLLMAPLFPLMLGAWGGQGKGTGKCHFECISLSTSWWHSPSPGVRCLRCEEKVQLMRYFDLIDHLYNRFSPLTRPSHSVQSANWFHHETTRPVHDVSLFTSRSTILKGSQ